MGNKIDDDKIQLDVPTIYSFKEIMRLRELRVDELAAAQSNLDMVDELLKKFKELGVGEVEEVKIE